MDEIDQLETVQTPEAMDAVAPDGSEIRLLAQTTRGSMAHCTLPPGAVSKAVAHHSVQELWYFLSGRGQVWRKFGDQEIVVEARPGLSLNIPTGTAFQFRNTGDEDLCFVIVTMPPWPGAGEAFPQAGTW